MLLLLFWWKVDLGKQLVNFPSFISHPTKHCFPVRKLSATISPKVEQGRIKQGPGIGHWATNQIA